MKLWECGGKRWIPFPFLEIINSQSVKEHLTRSHVCSNIPAKDWINIFCLLFKTTPITTISYILITTDGRGTSPEQRWKLIQVFRHFHLKILAFSLVYISCSVQNTVVTILFFSWDILRETKEALDRWKGAREACVKPGYPEIQQFPWLLWLNMDQKNKPMDIYMFEFILVQKLFPCLVVWK